MQIEVTKQEAAAIIQFADIAVRQSGLQAAEAGLVVATKFQKALDEEQKKETVAQQKAS